MSMETELLDDVIKELEDGIQAAFSALVHLKHLKDHGVTHIDEDMEPVIPDNVVFLNDRRVH